MTPAIYESRLFYLVIAGGLLMLLAMPARAAEIRAQASHTRISAQASFQLIFEITGEPDGPPELSVLQPDFDILGRSHSRSVSSIGGRVSSSSTLVLTLAPRTTGRLTIPAVDFGRDRSNPITVEVVPYEPGPPVESDDEVNFELDAAPEDVYVQQQILFTVRLNLGVGFARIHLGEPEIDDPGAILLQLGQTRYDTRRKGRSYSVLERRYAVFPSRSGRLTLGPVTFVGLRGTSGPAEGGDPRTAPPGSMAAGQVLRVRSEAIPLMVRSARTTDEYATWLPARNLQLIEVWPGDTRELTVGETLLRRVTLMADGLTAGQLPPLPFDISPDFEQYPQQPLLRDHPSPSGLTGSRQESITLIPTRAGSYTLPAIEIEWWNTASGNRQQARLPPRVIRVVDAAERDVTGLPAEPAPQSAAKLFPPFPGEETGRPSHTPPGVDWTELPSLSDRQTERAGQENQGPGGYWPWVALVLAFGWFFSLAAWWVGRRRTAPSAARITPPKPTPAKEPVLRPKSVVETAIEAVQTAYQDRDAEAAKGALLRWAKIVWRDQPPSNLSALAQRCPAALRQEILDLDRALYSPEPEPWHERPVWKLLSQVSK